MKYPSMRSWDQTEISSFSLSRSLSDDLSVIHGLTTTTYDSDLPSTPPLILRRVYQNWYINIINLHQLLHIKVFDYEGKMRILIPSYLRLSSLGMALLNWLRREPSFMTRFNEFKPWHINGRQQKQIITCFLMCIN